MGQAHDFEDVYKDLGINLNTLGCVMLDLEAIDSSDIINEGDLYYTSHPERFWINGRSDISHVTLRYGFLPGVKASHVDAVTFALTLPASVEVLPKLQMFKSPYPDEIYECIVAYVNPDASPVVFDFNSELSLLPNVNTFTEYQPHVTVAYVKQGWYSDNEGAVLTQTTLSTIALNYGDLIK